jgi:hypothetical protein
MVRRIGTAQERLQNILSKQRVEAMESEIIKMSRKGEVYEYFYWKCQYIKHMLNSLVWAGEVDEALVLLLEANANQAEAAGQ